ncbi:MAG TPA: carboxypeptidase regulatory-like domain-containing protein [Candidatus Angelobacter sp.]
MRSYLSALAIFSALAFGQSTNAPPPTKGQIEGTVVSAAGGQLLPRALVILRNLKGRAQTLGRADDNAHFSFDRVDPGSYQILGGKQGYYTDDSKRGMQPVVDLAAGDVVKDVLVRLLPLGVISGRIVDETNDPVRDVEVRLLGVEHYRGREFLNTMGSAISDDRGEYRIFDVRPGSYFLLAEHNLSKEWKKQTGAVPVKGSRLDIAYPPLMYPGTSDMLQAQKLVVNPGDDLRADFGLFPVQAVSIQGRVVNGLTNRPIAQPSVTAYWGPNAGVMARTAEISENGSGFEIRGIGPGTYTLRTTFVDDGESFSDERVVEIGSEGIRNVLISGLPDFEIVGHVHLENARYAFTPSVEFASVGPRNSSIFRVGTTRPDYQFTGKLHPGDRYRVNVPNLPQDFYLKSVRVSGREVANTDVVIGGRHTEIDLLVSPGGGHIEGTTLNDKHEPVSGSYVLLVPDSSDKLDADLIRPAHCDVKGKFVMRGVPPGSYKLFAFENAEAEILNQPDLLKNYEQNSQSVKVEEAGKYTLEIKPVRSAVGN